MLFKHFYLLINFLITFVIVLNYLYDHINLFLFYFNYLPHIII